MKFKLLQVFKLLSKLTLYGILTQCIFISVLFATDTRAQKYASVWDVEIEVKPGLSSVERLFESIETQTDYKFSFDKRDFRNEAKIDLPSASISVAGLLLKVSENSNLKFKQVNNNISVSKIKTKTLSDNERIDVVEEELELSGKVTDENGEALPGVNIVVKGSASGVVTDIDGNYRIIVEDYSILVFSYIGYKSQEVDVTSRTVIDIQLEPDASKLKEVVVNGYQEILKERNAGSYVQPEIAAFADRSTSQDVMQRLDGLVPGLTINIAPNNSRNVDGPVLGQTGDDILIRGLGTINASQSPLFVVDGVPLPDISSINPQDIENITVLKDATAASIWGARAANGVIVITTKRGEFNSEIKVSYNTFYSIQGKPDIRYKKRLNSAQYIDLAKEIFDPVQFPYSEWSDYQSRSGSLTPHAQILYDLDNGLIDQATADAGLNVLANTNNIDQIEDLYRNATVNYQNISVQGGSEKHAFFGSLAYTNTQGSDPGNQDKVYKLNINQDFKISERIDFRLNTDLTNTISESNTPLRLDNTSIPYVLFKDADGNHLNTNALGDFSRDELITYENSSGLDLSHVFLDEINKSSTDVNSLSARLNAGLNVKIYKGLAYEGTVGYFHQNSRRESLEAQDLYDVRTDRLFSAQAGTNPGDVIFNLPQEGGYFSTANGLNKNWTVRNQLTYNESWNNDRHILTALVGYEAQEQLFNNKSTFAIGYDPRTQLAQTVDFETLGNSISSPLVANSGSRSRLNFPDPFTESESLLRFTSWYSNLAYTFDEKYSLNVSVRADESNLFGLEKSAQNRPVWSVGAKWAISNESFMENVNWIDQLAFRTTYGITGNSPNPGGASSFDIFTIRTSSFARYFTDPFSANLSTPGNARLSWERTTNLNLGIDFAAFSNRIRGSVDYYTNKTEDLLDELPVNGFSGFTTITGNSGDLENKGIELSLQSLNIDGDFKWSTAFNLGHNKNKVTKLVSQSDNPRAAGAQVLSSEPVEGYSAFPLFAYDFVGLNDEGSPEIMLKDESVISVRNASDIGIEDLKYMGTFQPLWSGGFSNTFSYKGFTLTANMVYHLGHVMYQDTPEFYTPHLLRASNVDVHSDFVNRWKQPGDEATTNIPAYAPLTSSVDREPAYFTYSDVNVTSASYVKLRDITLQYALPKSLISKINAEHLSLRLQVNNLLLWTANNKGIDPEFHDGITAQRRTPTRQGAVTFGMRVTF